MKWVEFIGPSGVGKSYLFDKLLEKRTAAEWKTPDEGFERIFETLNERNEISLGHKLIILLKRLFNQKKKNAYKRIPSSCKRGAVDKYGSRFNFLSEVMLREFASVSDLEPKKKLEMISWYYEERLLPFIVLYASEIDEIFVFEDGILHNNRLVNMEKYVAQMDTKGQVIFPDAVIFLKAEAKVIEERIKSRNLATGGTFIQRDLTDQQIKKEVESSISNHNIILKHLKSRCIKILEIDTTENVSGNCDRILEFIRDLSTIK